MGRSRDPFCSVQLGPVTKLAVPVYSVSGHRIKSAECTARVRTKLQRSSPATVTKLATPVYSVSGQC